MTYDTYEKMKVMCWCRMQSSRAENMAGAFEGYFMRLITERC